MGIPFFYRQIVLRDQKNLICNVGGCDRLFLDYNSIIHMCAGNMIGKADELIEDDLFREIFNYTLQLTKVCVPKKLLYVAIDGVAPRSKIQQQRKRRYLSAYRNDIINKFKEKHDISYVKWDSNCITPGTPFMGRLCAYLNYAFKSCKSNFEIIFSDASEEGEGEQKIYNYIKANNKEGHDVIYGLDADLIMLSLCCPSTSSIYLMREGQNFMTHMTDYKYLNIGALRLSVSKYLYDSNEVKFMYDYVFICFILGNDFLPNVSCLKIKSGGIDVICDIYKKLYTGESMIYESDGRFCINYKFLVSFLEMLSLQEEQLMKEVTDQFYDSKEHPKTYTSKLDKFIQDLESYPVINKFPLVIDPSHDNMWKTNYYHNLFDSHCNETVKSICENYMEGLIWTVNYYLNGTFDKSWYYRYNYAPCVTDLHKFIKSIGQDEFDRIFNRLKITSGPEITPDIQVLMVLPPSSKDLLNSSLTKIMFDVNLGCAHFYPTGFCLTSYLKSHLWECNPVIPNVDSDLIIAAYEKLMTK